MSLIDLSRPFAKYPDYSLSNEVLKIESEVADSYDAVIHRLTIGSMCGTYIDFPGHICSTDDGIDAANYPIGKLYRQKTFAVHLAKENGAGAVTGEELAAAAGQNVEADCVIINALGKRNPEDIALRSVWLSTSAVQWIIDTGCHLVISDIYESQKLEGVFGRFFSAGISTVCCPANLCQVPAESSVTVLFCNVPAMKQLPCRVVAEF